MAKSSAKKEREGKNAFTGDVLNTSKKIPLYLRGHPMPHRPRCHPRIQLYQRRRWSLSNWSASGERFHQQRATLEGTCSLSPEMEPLHLESHIKIEKVCFLHHNINANYLTSKFTFNVNKSLIVILSNPIFSYKFDTPVFPPSQSSAIYPMDSTLSLDTTSVKVTRVEKLGHSRQDNILTPLY